MGEQIVTQYENYQELLLDLDIFGRLSSTKQLNLDEYKDLFFEEFKKQKPMPTMESKRYELSRLVDNSYRVEYNRQLELRENERLVDFNEELDEKEDKANRILENIEIDNNVKNLFQYENKVCDRDREEIIKKYSLENGELLQGVRPEKLMGTIQEDDSLKLDDIEIENLGAEVPKFHDAEFQPLDDYEEEGENKEQELEDADFDAIAFSDDVEIDAEDNIEEDFDSDSEDELKEDSDNDSEELEEDFDNDSEEEFDSDSEEELEEDSDEHADNSAEDIGEEFEYEENNNNIDTELEDTKTNTSDLSVEQLLSLLGSKLDANIDLAKLKQFVSDKLDNSVEPDSVLTEQKNDSKQDVTEVKTESKQDTIDDFFGSDADDLSEFFEEEQKIENSVVKKKSEDLSEFLEEKKEVVSESESSDKDNKQSQQQEVKEPEPTDLRAFIRKHPRCDYDFATQYFTPKQIAMEIKKGRVIKKGNMLKI